MPLVPTRTHRPAAADPLRRRLLTALAGAPVLAGLGACTGADDSSAETERIQLSVFWWGGQRRAELTEQALRLYSQRNPRVTFQVTWQGEAGYYERLATEASAGNAPDLFQIDDTYLTEYARRGILLNLEDELRAGRLDLGALAPGLSRYGRVDGSTVAVPAGTNTAALVYNRSLLRRLGLPAPTADITYPAFIDWATEVTAAGGGRVAGPATAPAITGRSGSGCGAAARSCTSQASSAAPTRTSPTGGVVAAGTGPQGNPGPALTRRGNHGDPRRQLVVSGHTAVSYAWSASSRSCRRPPGGVGPDRLPGPPTAHWRRASMYWAGFAGPRHPAVVADVINFLTNDPVAGLSLGAERGLSANLQTREVVLREVTDPATQRTARYEARWPTGTGRRRCRRRPERDVPRLLGAAESVQDGSATPDAPRARSSPRPTTR